jgi:uncharacterized protein (TIGR03663 family)
MQNEETDATRPRSSPAVRHSSFARRRLIFFILALLALAIRLPQLGGRPMHTDEAVNAYITGELLAGGSFHYDPSDRHGPVLYLLAEPIARLCGAKDFAALTETQLRLTPVIVGSVTVLLFGAGVEMFGFIACLVAALLFVIAPLPVYYSQYFIHETLFVAATLGLILSGWCAVKKNSLWSAALAGLCAALLAGCKETAVIHFFALGVTAAVGWLINAGGTGVPPVVSGVAPETHSPADADSFAPSPAPGATPGATGRRHVPPEPRTGAPSLKIVLTALGVFIVVGILLFTWCGQNWRALADLFRAVPNLAARAAGEGHEKPFGYYFMLFNPMFFFLPLGLVGIYTAIRDARTGVRKTGLLLTIYALTTFLIYSAIPYKTPWLALNLWLPLALLAGVGVEGIWREMKNSAGRWVVATAVVVLLAILGRQTKTLAFDKPADEKNPLAYAHTVGDLLRLPPRLEQLTKDEKLTQPLIAVVAADPWPLPWYLRKFSRAGFWQPGQDPGTADYYITSPEAAEKLGGKLKDRRPEFFGVRPEVVIILWPPKETPP